MFRVFTWRRIGKEEERKNFPYLSTLSLNSGNGFELSLFAEGHIKSEMSTELEKIEKEKLFDSLTCGICLDFFR